MASAFFSPDKQTSVWDVQTTIRQIDMSLFPSVKEKLGQEQTFVYSTLAGCCSFIGANLDQFSPEVQKFAHEIVTPVVKECFEELEKYQGNLSNSQLKLTLLKKLEKVQFHPERFDFETVQNEEMVQELQKVVKLGTFTLYKLNPIADKFYGGRIDISEEAFSKIAVILDTYGYKEKDDIVGSSFDRQGHITTIDPRELAEKYAKVVSAHKSYTEVSDAVALEPKCLEIGKPQSGRLSRAVTVSIEVNGLEKYREVLGPIKIPPHLSVFTQEIRVLPDLKGRSIKDFTRSEENEFMKVLHQYLSAGL